MQRRRCANSLWRSCRMPVRAMSSCGVDDLFSWQPDQDYDVRTRPTCLADLGLLTRSPRASKTYDRPRQLSRPVKSSGGVLAMRYVTCPEAAGCMAASSALSDPVRHGSG